MNILIETTCSLTLYHHLSGKMSNKLDVYMYCEGVFLLYRFRVELKANWAYNPKTYRNKELA